MILGIFISGLSLVVPSAIHEQGTAPFAEYRTFRCEFRDGGGRRVQDDKVATIEQDGFSDPLIVDNVNRTSKTARLVGNAGGSDLVLVNDTNLLITFGEFTPIGGVSFMSIFKRPTTTDGAYRAVFSRHLGFSLPLGSLSMTQYYGTCRGQF